MKKISVIIVVIVSILSLIGCHNTSVTQDPDASTNDSSHTSSSQNFPIGNIVKEEKIELCILKDDYVKNIYKLWHVGKKQDFEYSDAKISQLFDILQDQQWQSADRDLYEQESQDAYITFTQKNEYSQLAVNIHFDFAGGIAYFSYPFVSSDQSDMSCHISQEDIDDIVQVYYYYFTEHLE